MNSYEWKQEQRRERLERRAQRAQADSDRSFAGARAAVDGIPPGQPILVGHHSEKRHRAALNRHDQRMRKGFERLKEAQELAHRAAAVGTAGISQDDPDAVEKLGDKVEQLEARRDRMKQINTAFRKAKGAKGWTQGLDLSDQEAEQIGRNLSWIYKVPFPPYALTNIGARIRQAKLRAQQIEHRPTQDSSEVVNGVTITADTTENRLILTYPRRLTTEEYKAVRRAGFVWSRTRGSFVRMLGMGGVIHWARQLAQGFTP